MTYYIVQVVGDDGTDLSDEIARALRNDSWFPADGSPGEIRMLTEGEVRALSHGLGR